MAVAELTEDTTTEELQSIVDDIAAERAGETAPPPKSDAEIVTETTAVDETTAVHTDGETAKPKGKGEKAEDRSWLDDDLKAEVAAYGISEDTLADFSSREEVERAMRFFDKTALEAGRKAMAEGEAKESGRDEKGRFIPKGETETPAKEPEQPAKKPGYEIKLDKAVYDDEIVEEFTRMRDHYESRLEALEARFHEADARAEQDRFDGLVDSLSHTDLFGKADKADAKQRQRREDLYVAAKAQIIGLQAYGRPTEMSESLINRVARMVFAEELGKKDLKSRTSRISRQSNGRQGGGATRPTDPPENPRDWADKLYRELAGS